jgi:hypothetical protein
LNGLQCLVERKDRVAIGPFFKKLTKELPKISTLRLDVEVDPSGACRVTYMKDNVSVTVDAPWFRNCGFVDYAHDCMEFLERLCDRLAMKAAARDTTLEKIFGIEDRGEAA